MAGTIAFDTLQDGGGEQVSVDKVIHGVCYAWCNFNGSGTVAINASFNVTSLTDNGTGDYDVNLTNALPRANAACAVGGTLGAKASGTAASYSTQGRVDTTTVLKISTGYVSTVQVKTDHADISVAVFVNP